MFGKKHPNGNSRFKTSSTSHLNPGRSGSNQMQPVHHGTTPLTQYQQDAWQNYHRANPIYQGPSSQLNAVLRQSHLGRSTQREAGSFIPGVREYEHSQQQLGAFGYGQQFQQGSAEYMHFAHPPVEHEPMQGMESYNGRGSRFGHEDNERMAVEPSNAWPGHIPSHNRQDQPNIVPGMHYVAHTTEQFQKHFNPKMPTADPFKQPLHPTPHPMGPDPQPAQAVQLPTYPVAPKAQVHGPAALQPQQMPEPMEQVSLATEDTSMRTEQPPDNLSQGMSASERMLSQSDDNSQRAPSPTPIQEAISKTPSTSNRKKLRKVKCGLCDKTFSGISSHNRHVSRTHHNIRPFECPECDLQFGQKGSLDRHVLAVHLEYRPFYCKTCNKDFGRKDNLKIHIDTVHLKKKPHQCKQCSRAFALKKQLKNHIDIIHTKSDPVQCKYCYKQFSTSANLASHIKKHHKEGGSGGDNKAETSTKLTTTASTGVSDSVSAAVRAMRKSKSQIKGNDEKRT